MSGDGLMIGGVRADALAEVYGTPLYVYDEATIRARYTALRDAIAYERTDICYSCKANGNPEILALLRNLGAAGVDAVSFGEVRLALAAGFTPAQVSLTNPSLSSEDMERLQAAGVRLKVDSLSQLRGWRSVGAGEVWLRINPGRGFGHHAHVVTAGPHSKFGIYLDELDEAKDAAGRVAGLHLHAGCGALEARTFLDAAEPLFRVAPRFPDLTGLNLGGGLGVPYRPGEAPLDVCELGAGLTERFERLREAHGGELTLVLEPGRYLVAESGYLLTRVNAMKRSSERRFVIVDTGFNHLIRPILYDAYHEVVNASSPDGEPERVWVGGNVCESGDLLTDERSIPRPREGDLLALLDVGAYGYSMASHYTGAALPAEVMVSDGSHRLIRSRKELSWEHDGL
jgi:diaminopimelate decarboxylase